MVAATAGPSKKLKKKDRLRRERLFNYVKTHRAKLEKVLQRSINQVLAERPEDPYTLLLEQLSEHTREGFRLKRLRAWAAGGASSGDAEAGAEFTVELVACVRGAAVAPLRASFPRAPVARGLFASGKADEADAAAAAESSFGWASFEEAESAEAALVALRLQEAMVGTLHQVHVLDFVTQNANLRAALGYDAYPGEKPDRARLRNMLDRQLMDTVGRLLDATPLEALKAGFSMSKVNSSPPVECRGDLEDWQYRWPEILLPALQGASPRRRLCIGLNVWASTLPEVLVGGTVIEHIDPAAIQARHEGKNDAGAVNLLDATYDEDDERPPPDPDEFSPPLNAISILSRFGALVSAKAAEASGGSFPAGEDLAAALASIRSALEVVVPEHLATEPKPPPPPAEEEAAAEDAGDAGDAEAELPDVAGADVESEPPAEQEPSLSEIQRRSCVYFALFLDADAAFDSEGCTYTFAEGSEARGWEQLAEHYEMLCTGEPLLTLLAAPFSMRDPSYKEAIASLRARLPPRVVVMEDAVEVEDQVAEQEDQPPAAARGRVRNVALAPLGLAAKQQKGGEPFAGQHGLYDFAAPDAAAHLHEISAFLDVSLALPEESRRFLLPRGSARDITDQLKPFEMRLREVLLAAYARRDATGKRGHSKNLSLTQFRDGLIELGFVGAEKYIEPLFRFLDVSNNGSISVGELEVLQRIERPATLEEIDELRVFIEQWVPTGPGDVVGEDGEEEAGADPESKAEVKLDFESPLSRLWPFMDTNESSAVSFAEFQRALRKMKHPLAVVDKVYGGKLLQIFMCLDLANNGVIREEEWSVISMLSAKFQLSRVEHVREFMMDHFGSLKSAFKAMDDNRSGMLSLKEWSEVVTLQHDYGDKEDICSTFSFLDKDASMVISSKEFEFLEAFDKEDFEQEVKDLYSHVISRYGNIDKAFDAFMLEAQNMPGSSRAAKRPVPSAPSQQPPAAGVKRGLGPKEFQNGCDRCGFVGRYDTRHVFNFLDATHNKIVSRKEFGMLRNLSAAETMKNSAGLMKDAIDALKAFVHSIVPAEMRDENGSPWAVLHEEIRELSLQGGAE